MHITYDQLRHDCSTTLDRLGDAARAGLTAPTILALIERAETWRRQAPEAWRTLVDEVLSRHPLAELAARCPMTDRARRKPRGYAGDAVMLDYIYDRHQVGDEQLRGEEREVFRVVAHSPTCASVDYRRHLIASRINALAAARQAAGGPPPTLLSLACGHARELEQVQGLGRLTGRVLMCDQDGDSLAALDARHGAQGVHTMALTVRQFLAQAPAVQSLGSFDFVYSAGLYDYLEQRTASRLTRCLFDHVAPGGQLLLANFHPDNKGTGYMEAFMDWWLIYRDEAQMRELAAEIAPPELARTDVHTDPFGNVVYLTLTRV